MKIATILIVALVFFATVRAEIGDTRIAHWKGDAAAAYVFTIDDFRNSVTYADTFLANRGLCATLGPIVSTVIRNPHQVNWMKAAISRGHEIASHGWNHVEMRDSIWNTPSRQDALFLEIVSSKRWLDSVLTGIQTVETFLFPYCRSVTAANALAFTHYTAVRNNCYGSMAPLPYDGGSWNSKDFLGINTTGTGTAPAEIRAFIDQILESGGYGIPLFHEWVLYNGFALENAKALCDYLSTLVSAGRIWNAVLRDFVKYARQRYNGTITFEAPGTDSDLAFTLSDTLADHIYNFPLTLATSTPAGITSVTVYQNAQLLGEYPTRAQTLTYEATPDAGLVTLKWNGVVAARGRHVNVLARDLNNVNEPSLYSLNGSKLGRIGPGIYCGVHVVAQKGTTPKLQTPLSYKQH